MRILLTGGSANGKSTYAEALSVRLGSPRFYIAAMTPFGEESELRIARHRKMREQKGFATIERYTDLAGLSLPRRGVALLECLCNLTANEMFERGGGRDMAVERVLLGLQNLAAQCEHLIVVTNDVGSDGGGYAPLTMEYVDALGRINRLVAASCDCVQELVCGIPITLKGELPQGCEF